MFIIARDYNESFGALTERERRHARGASLQPSAPLYAVYVYVFTVRFFANLL